MSLPAFSITAPVACITLCVGVTGAQSTAQHVEVTNSELSGSVAAEATYETWWWHVMENLSIYLCDILGGCQVSPWNSRSAAVEARMQAQFDEYEANGLGSLTAQEELDLFKEAQDAEAHLLANPGAVTADLEADYLNMLAEIIEQLQP